MNREELQAWLNTFNSVAHFGCFRKPLLHTIWHQLPGNRTLDGTVCANKVYQALCDSIAQEDEEGSSAQPLKGEHNGVDDIVQTLLTHEDMTPAILYWVNLLKIRLEQQQSDTITREE